MIKKLLFTASVLFVYGLNAQSGKSIHNFSAKQSNLKQPSILISSKTATVSQTCDSIQTVPGTATITVATAGTDSTVPTCTVLAGYVYGTNCYDDREKANYNDGATWYGSVPNLSVTAVEVMFWKNGTQGTQGAASATVGIKLYAGNIATGPTGAVLGFTSNTMASVLTNSASGDFFFYTFNFTNPVPVPAAGFFASVSLPTHVVGDTAVIVCDESPSANFVWERDNDNSWHSVTETPASWGGPGNLVVIPKYCFNLSGVGISQNLGISKNVSVFPNPSNGIVKISTTFISEENINVTITNMLGQVVASSKKNALIDVLTLDISNQVNGVYFVSVSNATDKMVTRLVLNK